VYFFKKALNMKIIAIIQWVVRIVIFSIGFILTRLISLILGYLKIGSVLSLENKILTPVIHLKNHQTDKEIVLVGMMHIGDKEYYQQVQKLIDSFLGYKILYEGIKKLSEEEISKLSPKEVKIFKKIEKNMNDRSVIAALLRIQDQKKGLLYDPHWICTDMTLFEFIKRLLESKTDSMFTSETRLPKKLAKFEKLLFAWMFDLALERMSGIMLFAKFFGLFSKKERSLEKLIVHDRNIIAINSILAHVKDFNVVSIWGAAHLPGMVKELKKNGFRQEKKSWLVAYTISKRRLEELIFQ